MVWGTDTECDGFSSQTHKLLSKAKTAELVSRRLLTHHVFLLLSPLIIMKNIVTNYIFVY